MKRMFGKKVDPAEQAKEWKRSIAREVRGLDRQIAHMEREEKKVVKEIKLLAKQGASRQNAVKILAKQVVQVRNARTKLFEARAHMNSVSMELQQQLALIKVAGCMKSSAEVMQAVSKLVKIPEVQQTMIQLAREMEKAGLVEEIVTDGLDSLDPEGMESEVDAEVDKVITELTEGLFTGEVTAPTTKLPEAEVEEPVAEDEEEEKKAIDAMKARLQTL